MRKFSLPVIFFLVCLSCLAQENLIERSFVYGREYYVLRSGRAQMIIQSDKVNIGPAISYLLFDSQDARHNVRKIKAYNSNAASMFSSSALEVIMKQFPLTSLGHNTYTNWITEDGIPSVEVVWWASGVKVSEVFSPVSSHGVFRRKIMLESVDLVSIDTVTIKLSIPLEANISDNNMLAYENHGASIVIIIDPEAGINISPSSRHLTLGPIVMSPGEKKIVNTYLAIDIPSLPTGETISKYKAIKEILDDEKKDIINRWTHSNTIVTSDKTVQNLHDACRYILPGYVADDGTMDAGIFEYGAQWVRDCSNTTLGLIHIGEFELARGVLNKMLTSMINSQGATMIAGAFDEPDREQFDQMGEFMHAMKSYVDWTGDTTLLAEHRDKIVAMIERPLKPVFRDSTGMVHNRREFWERTFDDGYELAYQTWMICGLRDAADLAKILNAESKAVYWRKEADEILKSMLSHPGMKLVDKGYLIKRRNVNGEIVDKLKYFGWMADAPATLESFSSLLPDATMVLPIALGIIPPASELSVNTLKEVEKLWNRRWSFGGYDRYNTSSQGDQPGPWTFATCFILRAQHESGMKDLSRRSLEWLYNIPGGQTGAWFEEIPINRTQEMTCGLIPWTTAEVSFFMVHHLMGIKFSGDRMLIKPALYDSAAPLKADLRYKKGRISLEIKCTGKVKFALVNGKKVKPDNEGYITIPAVFKSGSIIIY